jgi:hypothetical protein
MYTTKKGFAFNPDKTMAAIKSQLLENEQVEALFVLNSDGVGYGIISKLRFAFFKVGKQTAHSSVAMSSIANYESIGRSGSYSVILNLKDGSTAKLGTPLKDDESAVLEVLNDCIENALDSSEITNDTPESRDAAFLSIESNFPWSKVPKHLQKNLMENISADETPLFMISTHAGSAAGSLVAMKDRCMIIKSGAIGGFMAGSLGGARVSSFYYRDITGIEYNSGFMSGVVEVLTASYDGSANKDYWKGTSKSRNADSNDPWTLSNTLPLPKVNYESAKVQFDKLRALISESKQISQASTVVHEKSGADELEKFAVLFQKGIIDEDEFKVAKRKILGV